MVHGQTGIAYDGDTKILYICVQRYCGTRAAMDRICACSSCFDVHVVCSERHNCACGIADAPASHGRGPGTLLTCRIPNRQRTDYSDNLTCDADESAYCTAVSFLSFIYSYLSTALFKLQADTPVTSKGVFATCEGQ